MFGKKINFIFLGLLLFLAVSVNAQTDIHKIDFKNFTYEIGDMSGEGKMKITVKDGNFSREDEEDRIYFDVSQITYGDVNGDGIDEAIIITVLNTGGTGNFTNGLVYTIKKGKPVILTEFEGGDRADGGLVSAKMAGNLLVVERNSAGETGGACCPEFIETTKYKWNGKELVQVGATTSRELYPATRVSFQKKTSMSVFSVKIPSGEVKRYTAGARAGQTLFVSTDAKNASDVSVRLVRGDGEETGTPHGISIKLNANGDYVFEISNNTDRDLTFSVKILIK